MKDDDEMHFGSCRLPLEGMSTEQLSVIRKLESDWQRNVDEMVNLTGRYDELMQLVASQNKQLQIKENLIMQLRHEEADDIARFRERHQLEIQGLQERLSAVQADCSDKELAIEKLRLDAAQLSQDKAMLQLSNDDLHGRARGTGDLTEKLARQSHRIQAMSEKEREMEEALQKTGSQLLTAQQDLSRRDEELRAALQQIADSKDGQTLKEQDFLQYRTTMQAELERQGQAMDSASRSAKEALQRLQEEQAKAVHLTGKLRESELLREEISLERKRLQEDVRRLRESLRHTQTSESQVKLRVDELTVLIQQSETEKDSLRNQILTMNHEKDNEREKVDQLADAVQENSDRLRLYNDDIDRIFAPSVAPTCLSLEPASDGGRAGLSVLPDEVDRVAEVRDQLDALVRVHEVEMRQLDSQQAAKDQEIENLQVRLEEVNELLQLLSTESSQRDWLSDTEDRERRKMHAEVASVEQLFCQERLGTIEETELDRRLDLEDYEGAEWALMPYIQEHGFQAAQAAERNRKLQEEGEKHTTRRGHTAYMGLHVSDGITIRAGAFRQKIGCMTPEGRCYDMQGVKVFSVTDAGPAQHAGLQADDVITAIDERPVRTLGDFRSAVKRVAPGDRVNLSVYREDWKDCHTIELQTDRVAEDDFEPGHRRTVVQPIHVSVPAAFMSLLDRADEAQKDRESRQRRKDEQRKEIRRKHKASGIGGPASAQTGGVHHDTNADAPLSARHRSDDPRLRRSPLRVRGRAGELGWASRRGPG
eukprot:TRINITY_DN940_c2_g1_i1.p1 TRINITY_DN940_c2_g1~~TRINITY_DN940_c2_g1_i1.p1  ORF type:complete len:764 (+),score=131.57 TRINITY_DN940_c2_g1_i1:93-2384(+)